mmetsp:Transcript_23558/g.36740  ORF Transcript_23558/g.36740 Transcript_23558/m.36740 type:complete len:246 (-) Transcript_23558:27-764(-)
MKVLFLFFFCCVLATAKKLPFGFPEAQDATDKYVIRWSTNAPDGYRVATFEEFGSDDFTDFYNLKEGIPYETTNPPTNRGCVLAVKEGYLDYPINHEEHSSTCTIVNDGDFACQVSSFGKALIGTNDFSGESCYGEFTGKTFDTPVEAGFFADNFYTVDSQCDWTENKARFQLFILDDAQTPTPSPTPFSLKDTYTCCSYYDTFLEFESHLCQYPGVLCPEVPNYKKVGNNTVQSCNDCYNCKKN